MLDMATSDPKRPSASAPDPTYVEFGRLIEKLIEKDGPSEAARKIGYSSQNLSSAASGARPLPAERAVELAAAYGVSIEALIPKGHLTEKGAKLAHKMRVLWRGGGASRGAMSGAPTTVATVQRRPPGLERWLIKRAGVSDVEFRSLERYRSRPGDNAKNMESDEFWDQELEYVRAAIRDASEASGHAGGEGGGHPASSGRSGTGKPSN